MLGGLLCWDFSAHFALRVIRTLFVIFGKVSLRRQDKSIAVVTLSYERRYGLLQPSDSIYYLCLLPNVRICILSQVAILLTFCDIYMLWLVFAMQSEKGRSDPCDLLVTDIDHYSCCWRLVLGSYVPLQVL